MTSGSALAGVGAQPGDLELLQAGVVVTSGPLSGGSPTMWQTTTACPAGFQTSAQMSEWTIGPTPTELSRISPVFSFGLANSTGFGPGSLDGSVGALLNFAGINASNPGTVEWVVGCYAGASGTGSVSYQQSTFISVAAGASVWTSSSSPPTPTWKKQTPATSPSPRAGAAMAYDAATGTTVMFGGNGNKAVLGDTWIWNGTTWTLQHPATSPPARQNMAMTYDATTGTVVMFGGAGTGGTILNDTWTWNGTTWTKQHPATSPSARQVGQGAGTMADDAAIGNVVLFGGYSNLNKPLADTWTWNGTTWTQQHPATSPSARYAAAMAYDAATGNVVLFGGANVVSGVTEYLGSTWTWNGTTWTKQTPATSPSARAEMVMTYDAATGNVVLFGGGNKAVLSDTWTWNGTTWTHQHPASSSPARQGAVMTYDGTAGNVVMFGGANTVTNVEPYLSSTWIWG